MADHAIIGVGPLWFYSDPGTTGKELSGIRRIMAIYRQYGFRTGAGENALPFGLEYYPNSFYAAWEFSHRDELGLPDLTLDALAAQEGVPPGMVHHIWEVFTQADPPPPTSSIVQMWRELPTPETSATDGVIDSVLESRIRSGVDDIYNSLRQLQGQFIARGRDAEERPVLTEDTVVLQTSITSTTFRREIEVADGAAVIYLAAEETPIAPAEKAIPFVLWKNPRLRFAAGPRDNWGSEIPLSELISDEAAKELDIGVHPDGANLGANDFATHREGIFQISVSPPEGMRYAEFAVDPEMDIEHSDEGTVRVWVSDRNSFPERRSLMATFSDPNGEALKEANAGRIYLAKNLPEVSNVEPAPADRDLIPPPFDPTYDEPERDFFHIYVKFYRSDNFIHDKILDEKTRQELDDAWDDLLSSFDYHETILRFAAKKYGVDLEGMTVENVTTEKMDEFPVESRRILKNHVANYRRIQERLQAAEPGQVENVLQFAAAAWRRPLTDGETQQLRDFYDSARTDLALDHTAAIRAMLTRVLVSPAFIYRVEPNSNTTQEEGIVPLSAWELANRLSYFLWSSKPDEELSRAAAADELNDPEQIVSQTRRMLKDPKARRLATEFFGQWLGFYKFDQYHGIDQERFPEFDDALKASLYDEAISFFEYIIRNDRPVSEILFADYSFLNDRLIKHYGLPADPTATDQVVKVDGTNEYHRGGLFGLGALLATTSAPLRTSPVRRGNWILTRIIGTHIPPPPPNVPKLPADDTQGDGKTISQRLEAHRADPVCANCHARFDPLGFALEHFDPVGQWRDEYREGQEIEDTGVLSDGTVIAGMDGLRAYLQSKQQEVCRALGAKLLGYALGRSELASDRILINDMISPDGSDSQEPTFSSLVEKIVTSEQFRKRRLVPESDAVAATPPGDSSSNQVGQSGSPIGRVTTQGP